MNIFNSSRFAQSYSQGIYKDVISDGNTSLRISNAVKLITEAPGSFGSFLDVGCATGNMHKNLKLLGYNDFYVGVDPSSKMLEHAFHINSGAFFVQGGLPFLPFDDNSMDLVLCIGTLFVLEDKESAIRELLRVARRHLIIELFICPGEDDIRTIYRPYEEDSVEIELLGTKRTGEIIGDLKYLINDVDEDRLICGLLPEISGFEALRSQGLDVAISLMSRFTFP